MINNVKKWFNKRIKSKYNKSRSTLGGLGDCAAAILPSLYFVEADRQRLQLPREELYPPSRLWGAMHRCVMGGRL